MAQKLQLYERVPKNTGYPRGEAIIEEGDFLTNGPVILGVSAQDDPKSVFGISKFCMNVVGIQIRENNPQGYNLEGFPVSFCSIKLENTEENGKNNEEDILQQFYEEYLKYVIEDNSQKKSVEEVAKRLRNLNILGYCNGNYRVEKIINTLKSNMERIGFSKQEIDYSISQIGLVTLATDYNTQEIGCTVVDFHEMKDSEVSSKYIHKETGKVLEESNLLEGFLEINNRRAEYVLIHSNEHSMKHYFEDGTATPACLKKVVSNLLISSINASKGNFVPLTSKQILAGCKELLQESKKGKSKEQILENADKSIQYEGAKKLTQSASEIQRELEMACDSIINLKSINSHLEARNKKLNEQINKMQNLVDEKCSENTAKTIKIEAGLWQHSSEEEKQKLKNAPSDKQTIKNQQSMLKTVLEFADKVRNSAFGKLFFRNDIKKLPPAQEKDLEK